MLYRPPSLSSTPITTGRDVARGKSNAVRRAFMAADLVRHTGWTVANAAKCAGVSIAYVYAAIAIGDDQSTRMAILRRRQPLLPNKSKPPESLAAHFRRSTKEERLEAAKAIGVSVVWDDMINPLLT